MKPRSICILGLLVGASGLAAFADPLNWFGKPMLTTTSTFKMTSDQPCILRVEAWEDGSAVFTVIPKESGWPAEKLPDQGVIRVNGTEFRMAPRQDKDGKTVLFGSVPVGTLDPSIPTIYTLLAYDANGVKLVDDRVEWWEQALPATGMPNEWHSF